MGVGWRRWLGAGAGLAFVVAAAIVWSRVGVTAASSRDVETGKQIYATHCATCHGETGKGDGASAAGLATKPWNLTDGRLMNHLPDEFHFEVISGGGPAHGLAPTMPPFNRTLSEAQIRQVIAFIRTLAEPPFDPAQAQPLVRPVHAPQQPIYFNHVIHATAYGIACQYCHADARRSEYAGLPSVERCLGCHKIIGAQDNPEIRKIHEYGGRREPIPWVRVFKVPEFTYFPHKPHLRADVACQTCHGSIERMPVVGADTGPRLTNDLQRVMGLRPASPQLTMGWCIECHRQENAARGTRAPLDCVTCHH
jgi:mono/diheme cytochrome c family protein